MESDVPGDNHLRKRHNMRGPSYLPGINYVRRTHLLCNSNVPRWHHVRVWTDMCYIIDLSRVHNLQRYVHVQFGIDLSGSSDMRRD